MLISQVLQERGSSKLTNKRQPDRLHTSQRHYCQYNPEYGLRIQRQPEETLIRRINVPRLWIRRLEYPAPVARLAVCLVPPAQPDQPPARNVLEVVEVDGEEEDCDDEDEHEVGGEEAQAEKIDEEGGCAWFG